MTTEKTFTIIGLAANLGTDKDSGQEHPLAMRVANGEIKSRLQAMKGSKKFREIDSESFVALPRAMTRDEAYDYFSVQLAQAQRKAFIPVGGKYVEYKHSSIRAAEKALTEKAEAEKATETAPVAAVVAAKTTDAAKAGKTAATRKGR